MMLNAVLQTYFSSRRFLSAKRTRHQFEDWQQSRLNQWLASSLPKVEYFRNFSGTISDLPLTNKRFVSENFAALNRLALTESEARRYWERNEAPTGYVVGASTGTSGNRGFYVISERETYLWLGAILAKALPDFWLKRDRVAVILPQATRLYESASHPSVLQFRFINIMEMNSQSLREIEQFNPTIIVAPPKIICQFVEENLRLSPRKIFAGAETLDEKERQIIERYFSLPLGQIYMATEGLLGVSCRKGNLHLCEDAHYFEYDVLDKNLVAPIITSFSRQTQIISRYQMRDLLRLSNSPCECGSPLQAVEEIVGRQDDCFVFQTSHGKVILTPDVIRNSVLDFSPKIEDFRVIRQSENGISVIVSGSLNYGDIEGLGQHIHSVFNVRDLHPVIQISHQKLSASNHHKLRRVENKWRQL